MYIGCSWLIVKIDKMVATLVFILGKSPYEDQNGKNGPYLVFILDFSPHFEEIEK